MDPIFILIFFAVGFVGGYVVSRNFIISAVIGVIAILIGIGVITVGFNMGAIFG